MFSVLTFSNEENSEAHTRIYLWSGQAGKKTRAKLKWDTAILPLTAGGIKVLDIELQSNALLVKMLTRGVNPEPKPWKALLIHNLNKLQPKANDPWPQHRRWMQIPMAKLHQTGSPLFQAIMTSWSSLQQGLEQSVPKTWTERSRQPIFGNRLLTSRQGEQWGMSPRTILPKWADHGLFTLGDLWD